MKGFTLLEIMVALALVSLLGGFALSYGLDTYHRYIFGSDRDALLVLLRHARAEAMNGVCDGDSCTAPMAHGVAIQEGKYVLFQGESYTSRDVAIDELFEADRDGGWHGLTEIVFEPLSGDVQHPGEIISGNVDIGVDAEGEIDSNF